MLQNVFFQYIEWRFGTAPKSIIKGWRNFILFYSNYFSILLLFKTLFTPWHKYVWAYPRGFDFAQYFETFFSNLISRIIGAIIRIIFIIVGSAVVLAVLLAGLTILIGWFLLPAILIFSFFYGFKILLF